MSTSSGKTRKEKLVAPDSPAAKRQEAAKKRREERMKQYEKNQRQWLMTKIGAGVLAAVIVLAIVAIGVNAVRDRDLNRVPDGVTAYTYAGGQHDDTFTAWTETPPVGGTHNNTWQKCGFYDGQINTGMGVHTMEHGAVWITYSPDLPQEQIDKLKDEYGGESFMLVSEFSGLPAPIVASAWGHQLQIPSGDADAKELKQFVRVYKNNAEYTPEFGATCANGNDTTIA
ncbi:MAG: DUF3105 domain-containing protein [Thermomicrobiales bacterium]|nr:DUF3105 domain-containing protein [Thermomicrobiales bacterium]